MPDEKPAKKPCSEKQRLANIANAQLSTGPRTIEGKNICKWNRLQHGLRAEEAVLPGESTEKYEARLTKWIEEWDARTDRERYLVERAVKSSWRLERSEAVEEALVTQNMDAAAGRRKDSQQAEVDRIMAELAANPAAGVRQLRKTPAGCRFLQSQFRVFETRLEKHDSLLHSQRVLVVHLLGRRLHDIFRDDPLVTRWLLAILASLYIGRTVNDEMIARSLGGQPEGMGEAEFQIRLKEIRQALPDGRKAVGLLQGYIKEILTELKTHLEFVDEVAERQTAQDVQAARIDLTPAGKQILNYATVHGRAFDSALRRLDKMQNPRPAPGPGRGPGKGSKNDVTTEVHDPAPGEGTVESASGAVDVTTEGPIAEEVPMNGQGGESQREKITIGPISGVSALDEPGGMPVSHGEREDEDRDEEKDEDEEGSGDPSQEPSRYTEEGANPVAGPAPEQAAEPMTHMTIEQAMRIAIEHHQAGRLAEAEPIYRQVLGQMPEHADALHLLGALALQAGRIEPAIDLIGRAIAVNPGSAEYHGTLGEAYRRMGQLDMAITAFRAAIALKPELALTYGNLGLALVAQDKLELAIAAFQRAIALNPQDGVVHGNLGLALTAAGRPEEALAAHERAAALGPGSVASQLNLAVAQHACGQASAAFSTCQRALERNPRDASIHNNLGMIALDSGQVALAVETLGRAVELDPNLPEAQNNLGNALRAAGRLDPARAALERAIALRPDFAAAYSNLANVSKDQGRLDEALSLLRKACALNPRDARTASNLLFSLHSDPDLDAQALLDAHCDWAEQHAAPLAVEIAPHPNDRTPGRKLKIGYVSPDFRAHAVGHLLLSLLAHHDRGRFEIVAYADIRAHDLVTESLKERTDQWHVTAGLSDAQLVRQIRADGIDILVDLALHTAGNRMLVFARKPAPVQVTMLGLPTTTGLETMDYRLTDPYLDPPGVTDADYTEQSIRLPHSFWIFPTPDGLPEVSALPAERNGFVTFGCLNQFAKVTRPALELWRQILRTVPGARLVLQAEAGSHRADVHAFFAEGGVAGDRVQFVAKAPRQAYFERFQDLDLGLDPFPYNGHTSTLDALWMGVPVVTLAGRTAVGRGGKSNLSNVGLTDLIASTPDAYVDIAVRLATDRKRLADLRAGLRERMERSPLVGRKQYTEAVEQAMRQMWEGWCGR